MLSRLIVAIFTLILSVSCYADMSLGSYIKSKCSKNCVGEVSLLNAVVPVARERILDLRLLIAIISVESGFVVRAKNRGNLGLMQILARVHKGKFKGRDIFDPRVNIRVGAEILHQCMRKTPHVTASLRCYNGNADKRYSEKVLRERALLDLIDIGT